MKKFTDLELAIIDGLHITPQSFDENKVPESSEVAEWCMQNGFGTSVHDKLGAEEALEGIRKKMWDDFESDCISLEDTATWVLSHYFTLHQLENMKAEEAEEFLRNWKYFFGYRKCDGWGNVYISDAISVLTGDMILDETDEEYCYIDKYSSWK